MSIARIPLVCLVATTTIYLLVVAPVSVVYGKVPETDKEIEQEFLDWVARVRTTSESTGPKNEVVHLAASNYATSDTRFIVVDKKGNGDFKSIKRAVKSIPDGNTGRTVISVGPGIFREHLVIKKAKGAITLQGAGNTKTIVTWHLDATEAGGTLKSASVSVSADDFIAKDITFENTAESPPPGAVGKQAVAFEISGDKAFFERVGFLGYQDTLYDRYGRHYFKDCYIRGTIDFIFGNGQSFYDTCYLESVAESFGSLSAQKRNTSEEDTGYVFSDCTVKGTGYLYLSRAWGPYSRVIFIRTYFDDIIRPEGWFNWGVPGREKTVFYGEYKCYGPGANRQAREVWSYELSDEQVYPFATKERWLGDWASNIN